MQSRERTVCERARSTNGASGIGNRREAASRQTLLPVEVAEGVRQPRGAKQHEFRIMIEARGARLTLDGSVDAKLVRTLLECLAQ